MIVTDMIVTFMIVTDMIVTGSLPTIIIIIIKSIITQPIGMLLQVAKRVG